MPSIKAVGAVALFLASFVAAQNNYTVDVSTIDPTQKVAYCTGEINTCGTLCDGDAQNTCDVSTLNYTCLCNSNSSEPGLKYYSTSMVSYLCQETFNLCNAMEVSAAGKAKCLANQKANCGTLNIDDYVPAAAETSSSSAESTAAPTAAGTSASTAPSTTSSTGFAPTMGAGFGTGVLAAGAAAAFGLML